MSQDQPAGPVVHSFFAGHLITVKGLRSASVRGLRLTGAVIGVKGPRGASLTPVAVPVGP
jgi:hypothetical protein